MVCTCQCELERQSSPPQWESSAAEAGLPGSGCWQRAHVEEQGAACGLAARARVCPQAGHWPGDTRGICFLHSADTIGGAHPFGCGCAAHPPRLRTRWPAVRPEKRAVGGCPGGLQLRRVRAPTGLRRFFSFDSGCPRLALPGCRLA